MANRDGWWKGYSKKSVLSPRLDHDDDEAAAAAAAMVVAEEEMVNAKEFYIFDLLDVKESEMFARFPESIFDVLQQKYFGKGIFHGALANLIDCDVGVIEFELRSLTFGVIVLEKVWIP